tara:strand:+ start:746 stop:1153 length:408 start_codon:yes stop_codon:yes gene_type:complete
MDIRDYAGAGRWWTLINGFTATSADSHYDSNENVVIKADEAISVRFVVCHVCQGRGNYVNPAIDSHGLTRDDFDADPDFYEDYRAGVYNIRCEGCEGRATVPVPTHEAHILAIRATAEEEDEVNAIYEAERRMGA